MEKEKIKWILHVNDNDGSCSLCACTSFGRSTLKVRANSISELMSNPDVQYYEKMFHGMFDHYVHLDDKYTLEQSQSDSEYQSEPAEAAD